METVSTVESVEEAQTRSGNTRYVVRDSDGNEYTTFRPQIGQEAAKHQGKRARIAYHEEERNGFHNVYLDRIERGQGWRRAARRLRGRGGVEGRDRRGAVAA